MIEKADNRCGVSIHRISLRAAISSDDSSTCWRTTVKIGKYSSRIVRTGSREVLRSSSSKICLVLAERFNIVEFTTNEFVVVEVTVVVVVTV